MSDQLIVEKLNLHLLGQALNDLGICGRTDCSNPEVCDYLIRSHLAVSSLNELIATNRLFAIGPGRSVFDVIRRALSLEVGYRKYLLSLLLSSLRQFADDESLGKTLEQLDHLSAELLQLNHRPVADLCTVEFMRAYDEWTRKMWQSPDAITLLSKVVETPDDFSRLVTYPVIHVSFDWLDWETPSIDPAPAPWADFKPLEFPLHTVKHPFWGAMIATLDACTGDYEWQSLILRGDLLRSFHRTLGNAQVALDSLWRSEFGLYPVDPLVITPSLLGDQTFPLVFTADGTESSFLPWLKIALDHLHRAEIAVESEGSWRLTDRFRTQLMKDDEHMMAFEAIRQRSYRLARSATKFTIASTNEVAAS